MLQDAAHLLTLGRPFDYVTRAVRRQMSRTWKIVASDFLPRLLTSTVYGVEHFRRREICMPPDAALGNGCGDCCGCCGNVSCAGNWSADDENIGPIAKSLLGSCNSLLVTSIGACGSNSRCD